MAKFLFTAIPEREKLLSALGNHYPEAKPHRLYTHMWMRLLAAKVEESIETFLGKFGISSGRYLVLLLMEHSDGIKPSRLALKLGVTQATVTGLLKGLEFSGYVVRKNCDDDGRACIVFLTEKGKEFLAKTRPPFMRWLDGVYSSLDEQESGQLVQLLEKFFHKIPSHHSPVQKN